MESLSQTEVTAVIVTHNHGGAVRRCIKSLMSGTIVPKILVIDCGSKDSSLAQIEQITGHNPVRIIRLGVNTGRAHALNTGIHLVTTPYALTLSPEVTVGCHFVEKFLNGMISLENRHKVVAVQGLILKGLILKEKTALGSSADGALSTGVTTSANTGTNTDTNGNVSDVTTVFSAGWRMRPGFIPCRIAKIRRKERKILASDINASLFCMNTLREVGLMDERLFGCLEDVDLGIRAARMGYGSWLVPDAVCRFYGAAQPTAFEQKVITGNLIYMRYKYNRPRFMDTVDAFVEWLERRVGFGHDASVAAATNDASVAASANDASVAASVNAAGTDADANDAAVERGRMLCFMAEMEMMEREELGMSVTKLPLPDEFCMEVSWAGQKLIYPLWLGERMESLPEKLRKNLIFRKI